MKYRLCLLLALIFLACTIMAFNDSHSLKKDQLSGSWSTAKGLETEVLLFMDGYVTHTAYNKAEKKFIQTKGGTYTLNGNQLIITYEFDSKDQEQIGKSVSYPVSLKSDKMVLNLKGREELWSRMDDGQTGLSGLWRITARKQEGNLVPIHQTGTRKTVKILTATRFQWAAIDPGTRQFMGTGGGTYTFKNGKYTENIEFFSRDSSRVGSSLTFDGLLQNGDWHHSGLSSKGDPIYEIWSRKK